MGQAVSDIRATLTAALDELAAARLAFNDLRRDRDAWRALCVIFGAGLAAASVIALAAVLR
jgi:uncharacterized membrane protein YjjP (DUF1212 family)